MEDKSNALRPYNFYPPYTFRQDEDSIHVTFKVPEGTSKSSLSIKLDTNKVQAGLKDQPPIIEGTFFQPLDSTLWSLDTQNNSVSLYLDLAESHVTWPLLIRDVRDISNPQSIDPHSLFYCGLLEDRRDKQRAFELMKKAAKRGHIDAQYEVGVRYFEQKNDAKAMKYFKMAALQGHTDASFTMGVAYEKGTGGLPVSKDEAIEWYKRCGDPRAIFHVGQLYMEKQEPHKAKEYFYSAIETDPSFYQQIPQEFKKWEATTVSNQLVHKPIENYFAKEAQSKAGFGHWRTFGMVAVVGVAAACLARALYQNK